MPRRRSVKPLPRPEPPSIVVRLGKAIVKWLGDTVYRKVEALKDDATEYGGTFDVSEYTLDDVVRRMPDLKAQRFFQRKLERAIERRTLGSTFGFDNFYLDANFDKGTIAVRAKVSGESIHDPDGLVEVPAQEDLIDGEIRAALRDLGCQEFSLDWTLKADPSYSDLTEIVYNVRARWDFDPYALLVRVLDPARLADMGML